MNQTNNNEFDISSKLAKHLDPNMMLIIIDFLIKQNIYDQKESKSAKLSLLLKTNMIEKAKELFNELNPKQETPKNIIEKFERVNERLEQYSKLENAIPKEHCSDHRNLIQLLELQMSSGAESSQIGIIDSLVSTHTLDLTHLLEYKVCDECVRELYTRAKFYCNYGDYNRALKYIECYININFIKDNLLSAYWGALCCSICTNNKTKCEEYFLLIKTYIESRELIPLELLQQRLFLLHWSLFFCLDSTPKLLIELLFPKRVDDKYLELPYLYSIQLHAPWLFRYVLSVVLMEERYLRDNHLRDIIRLLKCEQMIDDPIVNFVQAVLIDYDFERAQGFLTILDKVISSDYFLSYNPDFAKNLMKSSRCLVFEVYCKIYQVLDLKVLAEKLNFNVEETEKWIVDLLRSSSLNVEARIDSNKSIVSLAKSPSTLYHIITSRTKQIFDVSIVMSNITNTKT